MLLAKALFGSLDFSARVRALAAARSFKLHGSDEEPASSEWMTVLCGAMGEHFRAGITVLDYGCGAGRLAHFVRQRMLRFSYYGVEKPGSKYRHGEKSIEAAREIFGWDFRIGFDLIGSDFERRAIERADVAVLGSIFTHTDYEEMRAVLAKLAPIAKRCGIVVFSVFVDAEYPLENPGSYGMKDAYARSWFRSTRSRAFARTGLYRNAARSLRSK
jgi:hypothetical protein